MNWKNAINNRWKIFGIVLALSGIFFVNTSFLEQFSWISPEHKIDSAEGISAIKFLRVTFIILGFLFLFSNISKTFLTEFKIKNNKLNRRLIYLCFFLLLVLLSYFFLIFSEDYHKTNAPNFFVGSFRTVVNLIKVFISITSTGEIDINKIDLPIYYLYIKEDDIDKLNSNLPESGFQFVDAYLLFNGEEYKVKTKYRGDTRFHWDFIKKSRRINIKDMKLINFSNKFNVINPKFNSHMQTLSGYFIADTVGLLSPRSYHVALFINGNYAGVYYYSDQIDESYLRIKGKIPGDIYYGERNDLSESADNWDIIITHDSNYERSEDNINFLISSINTSDLLRFDSFFNTYLNEKYLKFYAFNILLGDSHLDNFHNHKFYFNPTSGQFEPIVWDQVPFSYPELPVNSDHNFIFKKISFIPELVERKNAYVQQFMEYLTEKRLLEYMDNTSNLIEYEITHDMYKDSSPPLWALTNSDWKRAVEKLKNQIRSRYAFLKEQLEISNLETYIIGDEFIVFDINGISGVNINLEFNLPKEGYCISLYKDENFNFKIEEAEKYRQSCPDNSLSINLETLYPGKDSVLRYVFILDATNSSMLLKGLAANNSITGSKVKTEIVKLNSLEELPKINKSRSLHPWNIPISKSKHIKFDGLISLEKDLILNELDTLFISPGTTIRFAPNVSIISYGKINAQGTKEKPIQFIALSDQSWGAIALQGPASAGSLFSHCLLEGGSYAEHNRIMYTGMLSAYNSKINISDCIFKNNKISDDAVNVKFSNIEIINSTFLNTFSDAIDLDMSYGRIENNYFNEIGGDAIDLMTSDPVIKDNLIIAANDKGISVGENSKPLITNNTILKSNISIAIKDLSNPFIVNNVLEENKIGIAAYKKNWRYGYGGLGIIINTDLCKNKQPISIDNESIINLNGNNISGHCIVNTCEIC